MTQEHSNMQASSAQKSEEMAEAFYGMVPNLIEVVNKHNPAVAQLYIAASESLQKGELQDDEREAVILAISRYNDCHYCVRAHAALGYKAGLSEEDIEAINQGKTPSDERLSAIVSATRLILDKNGWLDKEDIAQLKERGLARAHLYEINALIAIKTLSNYINHVEQTQVDDAFGSMMPDHIDQTGWAAATDEEPATIAG